MRILLIQADGKFPNLALMKLSAWHKSKGDLVYLNKCLNPDKVYISCIFSKNRNQVQGISSLFNCPVEIGGYGIDSIQLPIEIEHIMPDYSLYNIDYSIGYTSRGCIRNCSFCIIPKMEGGMRNHASLSEFLCPSHKKLLLLDNNFFASPNWKENIIEMIKNNLKVSFMQGLDIRIVTDEMASLIFQVKYVDNEFKTKRLYSAFDWIGLEPQVRKGIEILEKAGVNPKNLMFYVLVGYNSIINDDLRRVNILLEYGCKPYIMRYKNTKDLTNLARWINRGYYRMMAFKDYKSNYREL